MLQRFAVIATSLTLGLSAGAYAAEDHTMSVLEFRNAIISAMQSEYEGELCVKRLSDDSFRAGPKEDDCEYYAYLDSAYAAYQEAPVQGADMIGQTATDYVRLMTAGIDETNFEERLVVQLRPTSYMADSDKEENPLKELVARGFAGDMVAVLMLDSAETLAAVSAGQLAEHGLSEDRAFQLAVDNTRARMGEVHVDEYRKIDFMSSANGLISGQVWLPETCNAQSRDAVYFVYDRNGIMAVNLDNVLGISNLIAVANGLVVQGESLTSSVIRCKSGQWTQLWPSQSAENLTLSPNLPG